MPMRHLVTYKCADDLGRRHDVQLWEDFNTVRSATGATTEVSGEQELRLIDGSLVGYIDDRTFQVLHDDTILHRVD
ncbi:MAG: hypothetical protein ACU0E9_04920 [Limimaricola soesokkakensis]|uniref:hypothetical protein n=1 Tax=Limimaricola soesokkakensis TaxID=1343159 RepID=UPI004058C726